MNAKIRQRSELNRKAIKKMSVSYSKFRQIRN